MNLAQYLLRLAHGPVGDLSIGGNRSGAIPDIELPAMLEKTQAGLTALHTRFALSLKTLSLKMVDGLFVYPLCPEFALTSTSGEINKFIQDSVGQPFLGDIIAIERIFDANRCELPLNDRRDCASWFTTEYDTLTMDYPVADDIYFVEYRANHAALVVDNPETQNIRLPVALEEALLAKVAYDVFCSQTGESAAIKAAELRDKYEMMCAEIEARNTTNTSVITDRSDRVREGGWI